MSELSEMFIRQRKYILILLAVYLVCWGVTPYQSIFLGLILGTSLSLFNLWNLAKKTAKFGETVASGEKKKQSLGLLTRMAVAVLAVAIAMEYPGYIHIISVIIGLMTCYIVIMIDSFFQFILHK